MSPSFEQVAALIGDIEAEMRRTGLWQEQPPDPALLQIDGAFGRNRLTFSQWLQFVFLSRVRTLLQEQGPWPRDSQVGTMAIREWDGLPELDPLIGLLCAFDHAIKPSVY